MKKIAIISTFPTSGSKNIGDYLISKSTERAIRQIVPDCEITTFFRADKWESIREDIKAQDHIIFACLAIRARDIAKRIYPYINEIIGSGIPFTILAAGTQLPVHKKRMGPVGKCSNANRALLNEISDKCCGFSTRGCVTQAFCSSLGLETENAGDIAYFDKRFDGLKFEPSRPIKRIAISDPHYWRSFRREFSEVYYGLKYRFPEAEIIIPLHGKSGFREVLEREGLDIVPIYENPDNGLDIYDSVDLHVGFRVHAHVSMLKRRRYSYLIEQDGRGCDYGRNMNANISVPCYVSKTKQILAGLVPGKTLPKPQFGAETSSIIQLLSMIDKDNQNGFSLFSGLEGQIEAINNNNVAFIARHLKDKCPKLLPE